MCARHAALKRRSSTVVFAAGFRRDRNPMRLRVVESHFSQSAREMGHPACVKVRVKIKVKGNGPECPFHPSRSGDSRFLTELGARFGMTGIGAGFACSVPLAAFGLPPCSFF